jgi:hypothetical protein
MVSTSARSHIRASNTKSDYRVNLPIMNVRNTIAPKDITPGCILKVTSM